MDVKPEQLIPESGAWGIIGSLMTFAIGGMVFVGKAIFKSKKARQMLAAGIDPEDNKEQKTVNPENQILVNALLAFIKNQENDRQADRTERSRQWERIEEVIGICREQAEETRNVVSQIENTNALFQQAFLQLSKEIGEVKANQIRLSDWLRDHLPPQQNFRQPRAHG